MTPAEFKSWRKRLGLTQSAAAEALGVSRSWLASVEIGRREISRLLILACEAIEARGKQA